MPFKGPAYTGVFDADDLKSLHQAYNLCCKILKRCPTTHEDRDQLARYVIRSFSSSNGDIELAAQRAADLVKLFE